MVAGAWPFLVGGVICLVKSDNERDLILLNSTGNGGAAGPSGVAFARPSGVRAPARSFAGGRFLERHSAVLQPMEV